MLFTMTVPFLEVVMHTKNEIFKESARNHVGPDDSVGVVMDKSGNEQDSEQEKMCGNGRTWFRNASRLMLPINSTIFIFTFWTVGIIASYSSGASLDRSMTECLAINLN